MAEKAYRSVVKSVSWRITGTLDTIIISWVIIGEVHTAVAIGGVEVFTKMLLYFQRERAWNRISFGKIQENEGLDYQI